MNTLSNSSPRKLVCNPRAFTLVELLVVIGVIGVLIGLLLPSLNKAQAQALKIKCMANMQQIGQAMLIYAEQNDGFLFPPNKGWPSQTTTPNVIIGTNPPQYDVWTWYVLKKWNDPVLICPADNEPTAQHSYMANAHLMPRSMDWKSNAAPGANRDLKYGNSFTNGHTPSDVIVLGEKVTSVDDYYMEPGDFDSKVEQYRHGVLLGSNYLMWDMHVETLLPAAALGGLDPWDPSGTPTTQD
jgi:prepilin-type N-terminal cleavage/methylation domain-containing protein